jgi:predicted DNA-binding transcriptional regulator AlpA
VTFMPTHASACNQKLDTPDCFLTGKQVRARYGGISEMTVWRWLKDESLCFPQPLYIQKRRFWKLADIEAFEAAQAAKSEAA